MWPRILSSRVLFSLWTKIMMRWCAKGESGHPPSCMYIKSKKIKSLTFYTHELYWRVAYGTVFLFPLPFLHLNIIVVIIIIRRRSSLMLEVGPITCISSIAIMTVSSWRQPAIFINNYYLLSWCCYWHQNQPQFVLLLLSVSSWELLCVEIYLLDSKPTL